MKTYPRLFDPHRPLRERAQLLTASLLDIVRCPLCRWPLVARMLRHGPGFPCACRRGAWH